jgi:transposase-like protein
VKIPFRYFKASPEVIRLSVMMYVRFPLSLLNVEGRLHENEAATLLRADIVGKARVQF